MARKKGLEIFNISNQKFRTKIDHNNEAHPHGTHSRVSMCGKNK
jgi:hypothetical protein